MEALAARLGSHMRLDREKAVRELGQHLDTGGAAAVVAAEAVARELLTTGGRWEALHGGILAGILLTQTGEWEAALWSCGALHNPPPSLFRLQGAQTCFRPGACLVLALAHQILRWLCVYAPPPLSPAVPLPPACWGCGTVPHPLRSPPFTCAHNVPD